MLSGKNPIACAAGVVVRTRVERLGVDDCPRRSGACRARDRGGGGSARVRLLQALGEGLIAQPTSSIR